MRVLRALRLLEAVPNSGRAYPDDSPFRGARFKIVVVRARKWSSRITYDVVGDEVWIRYIYPSWYPATHPDLALVPPDDER